MKTNLVKHSIQKILSPKIFKIFYYFWVKFASKPYHSYTKLKLRKFRQEFFKKINFLGIKFKILIDHQNGTVDDEIYLQGIYEPYILSVIKDNLKEGDVFVDIGANIGQHSLFASRVVGDNGKVISFEPISKINTQFKKSIEENNFHNIILRREACGEKPGTLLINLSDKNIGASSLISEYDSKIKESIDVINGDSILLLEPRIDFIKIDVEGYEYEALLGIKETITKFKPKIILEYTPYYYDKFAPEHKKEILRLLLSLDYKIIDIEQNNAEVLENYYEKMAKEKRLQTNILAKTK